MDGGCLDRQMDGWIKSGSVEGWLNIQMVDEWIDGLCVDGYTNEWVGGWVTEQMDGQVYGWLVGWQMEGLEVCVMLRSYEQNEWIYGWGWMDSEWVNG